MHHVDVREGLARLPDESVDIVITSPPYYGKRDYGAEATQIWASHGEGWQNKGCEHTWEWDGVTHDWCSKCDSWRGQLGLEADYRDFVQHLFEIFMECRRVLKRSGSLWINIGDTYSGSSCGSKDYRETQNFQSERLYDKPSPQSRTNLPNKCRIGIPWRLALKLIDEGNWVLRNGVIWEKLNAKPESMKDRFTNIYEDVFYLVRSDAKSEWYILANKPPEKFADKTVLWQKVQEWWNSGGVKCKSDIPAEFISCCTNLDSYFSLDNVRVPHKVQSLERYQRAVNLGVKQVRGKWREEGFNLNAPEKAPRWFREQYDKDFDYKDKFTKHEIAVNRTGNFSYKDSLHTKEYHYRGKNPGDVWEINTESLREKHYAPFPSELCERIILACCPKGGVVLDPFCGSGRALTTAKRLGRKYIGFECVSDYVKIAEKLLAETKKQPEYRTLESYAERSTL